MFAALLWAQLCGCACELRGPVLVVWDVPALRMRGVVPADDHAWGMLPRRWVWVERTAVDPDGTVRAECMGALFYRGPDPRGGARRT